MERRLTAAVERAGRLVVKGDPEDVLAIGREIVDDRNAAACPVRRALDVIHLRDPARELVGRLARARVRVANSQAADLAGRAQVAGHQRRRQQLNVGNVVEIGALRVERQVLARVDVERQEVVDGALVLGAIETLKGPPAGVGIGGGQRIEVRFECCRETLERDLRRPARARGRHHTRPQLADHFFGDRGVPVGCGDLERLQRQVAATAAIVVAPLAGPGNHRLGRVGRHRLRLDWCPSGICGLRCCSGSRRRGGRHPHSKQKRAQQPVVQAQRRTEGGEAPRWQGAPSENIGNI